MKTVFAFIGLASIAASTAFATNYYFGDYNYSLEGSNGTAWDSASISLGKFSNGFVATSSNLDQWASHWISDPAGYYDGSSPEWSASLTLADNSTFAAGDELSLWAYNSLVGPDRQWALLSDPSWKIVANSPLDLTDQSFDFTAQSSASFGQIDLENSLVQAAPAGGAVPVPEPATWMGVVSLFGLAVVSGYKRRQKLKQ